MNDQQLRPPQQCRAIVYGATYNDGTEVSMNHVLEWKGLLWIRCNPEKDDIYRLHASEEKWTELCGHEFEVLGRTPGAHTLQEKLKDPDFVKRLWASMDGNEESND